jgi:hypothetical protein
MTLSRQRKAIIALTDSKIMVAESTRLAIAYTLRLQYSEALVSQIDWSGTAMICTEKMISFLTTRNDFDSIKIILEKALEFEDLDRIKSMLARAIAEY